MSNRQSDRVARVRRAFVFAAVGALAFGFLLMSNTGQAQQDGRPRRTQATPGNGVQQPQAKPTPTPQAKPSPTTQTPRPAQTPAGQRQTQPQTTPSPSPAPTLKPTTGDDEGDEIDPDARITVDTSLVTLNVRVIDRNNRPINDVQQSDFHVFEDGVAQTVEFFTREEVPISYGLAIDTSGSLRSQIDRVIDAGKTIVNSNRPGDETFLMRFIDKEHIETVVDFSPNKETILDGLDSLYVEGGQTAVVDAVYLASEHVAEYKKGNDLSDRRRRALILVTDGEDRDSFYKQEQLFARLREEDVQIFVIGFVNELDKEGGFIRKSPKDRAVALLERIAKESGGRVFFPTSISELPQIANEIVRDLRTQYVIGYNPTNKRRDGTYRTVRVAVADASGKDKRIALTRSGYVAKTEGGQRPQPQTNTQTPNTTRPKP